MDDPRTFKKYASKRDLVVEALREMILSGQILPGQRLRQEELTRMLGVSATPIREAIRLLEADGLLCGEAHHGVSVVEITPDELQDICRIRSMLEGLATRQAVDRSDPQDYAAALEHLETIQSELEAAVRSGTVAAMANLNRAFHLQLYTQSGSPYLIDMIRRLWMHQPGYMVWDDPKLAAASVEQHKAVLAALRARHAEAAAQAIQVHIQLSAVSLAKEMRRREEARPSLEQPRNVSPKGRNALPLSDLLVG
ncbi:MAG: GntR family transcriptional regulator [Dehalococcoidia bacterium]|nr:GntR family transcriptional regulator [Dehalococcoidia bacterium]